MLVDTIAKLRGRVDIEQVSEFIRQNFDTNVKIIQKTMYPYDGKFIKDNQEEITEIYTKAFDRICGYIQFKYNDKPYTLFYIYCGYKWPENLEYYKSLGLEEMVMSETTSLMTSCTDDAKLFMEAIVKAFGGWIDYDDCDDEPYIEFKANTNEPIKVKHITRAELYEKFGCFVIIDD